jgi:formate hydrogenlyase subunit 3/multisubunit Na+/H+ antiporter MnhD subunit
MNNLMLYIILLPLAAGLAILPFPKWQEKPLKWLALAIAAVVLLLDLALYTQGNKFFLLPVFEIMAISLASFNFSALISCAVAFFTVLTIVYSFGFMQGRERLPEYYGHILVTLGAASGAVFAADFITLIVFWGILGITLYKLIGFNKEESGAAAKKTFIIVGGADAVMLIGISMFFMLTGSFSFYNIALPLTHPLSIIAFLCLLAGALAKAGAFPLHTWIPAAAETTPSPLLALLPASLDKLLGIYLLARLTLDIFILTPSSLVSLVLLIIGAVTIIGGVMMALIQHNFKKLLAYHAVSQVGYMLIGLGTATSVGIAGGLFHMLNHAIYKATLFLAGGAVKAKTKTAEIEQLGGLAAKMPFTFSAFLIAALAISGIPPLNGFFSKWMIYQGILELSGPGSYLWIVWLAAAMFGSALTLASFMKLTQAIFFGDSLTPETKQATEVSAWMWAPVLLLSSLCVIFGVFAYTLPLKIFILPYLGTVSFTGHFAPMTALILLAVGIICGAVFYLISNAKHARVAPVFTGGEDLTPEETKVSAAHFYDTIKDLGFLKKFYNKAEAGSFDLYEQGGKLTFGLSDLLKAVHHGLLHTYVAWCLIGLVVLLFTLYR